MLDNADEVGINSEATVSNGLQYMDTLVLSDLEKLTSSALCGHCGVMAKILRLENLPRAMADR